MTLVKFNTRTRNSAPYFNNVFDSLFSEAVNNNRLVNKVPAVNIIESKEDYKIEMAAPGLEKGDFQINLKKSTLSVWAEKKAEDEVVKKNYSRKEFDYLSFARSFELPESVDADKVSAEYLNGVLLITIGKKVDLQPESKDIKVL